MSMNNVFRSLLAATVVFTASHAYAETNDSIPLTLEQCIAIGLDKSPTIKVADMEITRVEYSKKELVGQLLPNINFTGSFNRTIDKQVSYIDIGALSGGGGSTPGGEGGGGSDEKKGIKMGLDNSYSMGFTAQMPIIAPSIWKSLKLRDIEIEQSVEKARSSRLDLISQIKAAYYGALFAQAAYEVVLSNRDRYQVNADIAERRYRLGAGTEYDALRAQVQVTNCEPEIIEASITIQKALLQLKVLMGMDVEQPIKLTKKLSDYEQNMYADAMNIDRSLTKNTELAQLDLQTNYLQRAKKVSEMAWYPTLNLNFAYNWNSMSQGNMFKNFRWNPYSFIALQLNIPIYAGGQRYSKYKQAEISVAEMGYQRENLERSLKMQVDIQVENINRCIRQISASASSMKSAEKANEIMHKSFEVGSATYIDLRDAEYTYTSAQLAYYQQIYNYLTARNDLERLLGTADTTGTEVTQ